MSNSDFAQLLESSEGLTEQFKNNASQLFEQAVESRANELVKEQLEAVVKGREDEIRESVAKEYSDKYQWMVETNEQLTQSLAEQTEKCEAELKAKDEECEKVKAECDKKVAEKVEECDKKVKDLEESIEKRAAEASVEKVQALRDRLAGYADYVAEQYVAANKDAIVSESKKIVADGILESVRNVLAQYGLGAAEGKEAFEAEIAKLTEERDAAYSNLAEAVEAKFEVEQKLNEQLKKEAFESITEGLTEVDRQRVRSLVAEDTSDLDTFKGRVKTLTESFAKSAAKEPAPAVSAVNVVTESAPKEPEQEKKVIAEDHVDRDVAFFVNALSSGKADHY